MFLALAMAVVFCAPTHAKDKLDSVRDEVRKDGSGSSGGSSSSGSDSSGDDDDSFGDGESSCPPGEECDSGGALLFAMIAGFAFYLPHVIIEGDGAPLAADWFPRYPYQDREPGYMRPAYEDEAVDTPLERTEDGGVIISNETPAATDRPPGTRPLALRIALEYGHGIDDDIHKPAAYMLFSTRWRIGLEAGMTYLREQPSGGLLRDQLMIGDANAIFRFAQNEYIQMRAGLGVRLMYDEGETDAGFNFAYGMDLFPVNPLVISGSIDLGNLGRAFVMHGRGTVGVSFFGVELFVGWDGFLFDNPFNDSAAVAIHGPVGGLRGWL